MNERILVVDDEEQIRRAVGRALSARGYDVTAVEDGEQALLVVERAAPDLIVLDLNLPGIDGVTVARRVRGLSGVP
ncbi:MAG: response regulator, partial [Actinomycetota bacterium]